jgi:hypothetical protein
VKKLKLQVPTYNRNFYGQEVERGELPDFGDPHLPVLVHESEGVRIILGTHDIDDMTKPDILIEGQPNGWAIFLHPLGGSDPSGCVFFLDDGRSFLVKECPEPTPEIEILDAGSEIPEIDGPSQIDQNIETGRHVVVNKTITRDEPRNSASRRW